MSGEKNALDEHVRIQNSIQIIGQSALALVSDDELDEFIRACEKADTLGPYQDPTAWIAGRDQLRQVIDHARALARYRKELKK